MDEEQVTTEQTPETPPETAPELETPALGGFGR